MSETSRIWVVGAGGIGSVAAGKLGSGASCTMIDGWPANVDEVRANGMRVAYPEGAVQVAHPIYGEDEIERIPDPPDFVLLAVKSHRTRECVELLLPRLGEDSVVVSLQNGVNEDLIADLVGRERTLGAVVDFGAEMAGPGRVRGYALDAGMLVGELDGEITPRLRHLAGLFDAEIPVEPTDNIWGALWSKLMVNVQVNALCALSGLPTDRLAEDRPLRRTAIGLAMEA
ncbi:MAG TPA: 2-dehydropantoate 2-reductase N-terminal domain-containing protein, partial [Solirubrobacterales bacterium]|nr:2-dehydropantoate 2-reductase N-terminal domain-containing protein [Solirubrobacterales bacterium]